MGRTAESDITINDYAISKRHAAFARKGNRYFITDLGSTNGVMVNNKKVQSKQFAPLRTGKHVVLGRFSLCTRFIITAWSIENLSTLPIKKLDAYRRRG